MLDYMLLYHRQSVRKSYSLMFNTRYCSIHALAQIKQCAELEGLQRNLKKLWNAFVAFTTTLSTRIGVLKTHLMITF